jgi:hypothetical protein
MLLMLDFDVADNFLALQICRPHRPDEMLRLDASNDLFPVSHLTSITPRGRVGAENHREQHGMTWMRKPDGGWSAGLLPYRS